MFHMKFIQIIKECINLVSYSILVNGSAFDKIIPFRGLRKGEPLSLYYFILKAEALSKMFIKAENEGLIYGVKVAKRSAPSIFQLFFADDSFMFLQCLS